MFYETSLAMSLSGRAGFARAAVGNDRSTRSSQGRKTVNRPPDFDELFEGAEPEDVDRLRRVHELLVEAGPPPELSPALASAPLPGERARKPWFRRRVVLAVAVLGAVLAATFGLGYLAGSAGSDESGIKVRETIVLSSDSGASGVVDLGFKGEDGNWPMIIKVRGLAPLHGGDYYSLQLTKGGKPIVTCGTFNVSGGDETTVRMVAAYELKGFDGWAVTLWHAETHDEEIVLTT
jgi:hypothetical protein